MESKKIRKIHRRPILRYKMLTKPQKTKIKRLYKDDKHTIMSIAKDFGVSHHAIWQWLKKLKVDRRDNKIDIDINEVLRMYNEGYSQTAMAEYYGCSRRVIYTRLKELGLR